MRIFQYMTLFLTSQLTLEQAESCYLHGRGSDFEFSDFFTSCYKKEILISTSGMDTVQYSGNQRKDSKVSHRA